jgi:hypothetical protein
MRMVRSTNRCSSPETPEIGTSRNVITSGALARRVRIALRGGVCQRGP